jgi:hypothetical protein
MLSEREAGTYWRQGFSNMCTDVNRLPVACFFWGHIQRFRCDLTLCWLQPSGENAAALGITVLETEQNYCLNEMQNKLSFTACHIHARNKLMHTPDIHVYTKG